MIEQRMVVDASTAVGKLVEAIEKASPILWRVAYRQVFVELGELVFTLVALLLAVRYLYRLRWQAMHRPKRADGYDPSDDADDKVPTLCTVGVYALLFVSLILTIYIFDYALNPTYVAIKELKGLL